MSDENRLPAELRYLRDPAFKSLVDSLEALICEVTYTPRELRESISLAATHFELHTPERMRFDSSLVADIHRMRQP